jgi:heme oxygenase
VKARAALKAATAAEHERVDALFSRFDLSGPAGYGSFLLAQAAAFLPIEDTLEEAGAAGLVHDWPGLRRSHYLREDLESLGLEEPVPLPPPDFPVPASVLGGIYVLEGSRLGGAVLKRTLFVTAPRRFLSAPQTAGSWRKLLETLDQSLYDPEMIEAAAQAARGVFQRFEAGALRYLGGD